MKVLCITSIFKNITILKVYEVQKELRFTYEIIDDVGNVAYYPKDIFKVVHEKWNTYIDIVTLVTLIRG